jgi:uncharacterized protein YyaL (SSP411 family)
MKEDYDGAEPSANSVSACNLMKLYYLLHRETDKQMARSTILAFEDRLLKNPTVLPLLCVALQSFSQPPTQIVIASPQSTSKQEKESDEPPTALIAALQSLFLPNKVIENAIRCFCLSCSLNLGGPVR